MAEIRLEGIAKSFGSTTVIPSLDLEVADRSFTAVVGPSGCGKSTLLRLLAGLEDADAGRILIDGEDVTGRRPADRGLAMVFQSYALYPHMTVRENIAFSLKLARMPKDEIARRVDSASRMLELEALLERRPRELSGGQRQRVAIGRAIVREPRAFLFDEPLSNLDAGLRAKMRLELIELHQRLATTMVYVTHDQVEAMTMADRIVLLNAGRIEQIGAPLELYRKPASLFVATFIGSPPMNLLTGGLAERFGAHTLGIRPEHLRIGDDGGDIRASVRALERLGKETNIQAESEALGLLTIRVNDNADLDYGEEIDLTLEREHLHRFDAAGYRIADADGAKTDAAKESDPQ